MNTSFSFIILTYNEEMHLPRLLNSIARLNAPVYILDSGSTDNTVAIGEQFGAEVLCNPFDNHPRQWHYALGCFDIKTPWIICLDADHVVTPELAEILLNFRDEDYSDTNGIYFNRKNFFKGQWIKHGGYYPFYLLKMFRYGHGFSDLNENMDHHFVVDGKTQLWKTGHLLEENLKENNISFWINKHNRYSDLLAHEEVERMQKIRWQTVKPRFWGAPDERTAWLKAIWWQLPRYVRPMIYFFYRFIIRLGFMDGKNGIIFHFLQGFWFRLVVDIKIEEIMVHARSTNRNWRIALTFAFKFVLLFALFYYFNLGMLSLTSHGGHYNAFIANHLNYIQGLRDVLINSTAWLLRGLGHTVLTNHHQLLVPGRSTLVLAYSCLGLGISSFLSAFALAYPAKLATRLWFMLVAIVTVQLLNVIRFALLALYWNSHTGSFIDHHTLFNIIIYIAIATAIYFWTKHYDVTKHTAKNRPVYL
ncbi:hypothetical protein GCM10023149_32300 [Mucilaginibacter gynuensis]|uniref:Glycosyltransferase 2-like domain-containing protein n=1 Tax=Mucilaginibacter gynuensis TaxID=1302236 RepID=A0ABP8GQM2_9SPHI